MKKCVRPELTIALVLVALSLLSAGCGGASPSSTTTKTASGELSANPASIAFGNVAVNTTTSQNVQLSNAGASSVTVSSASTSGPGFRMTGLSVPMTLPPSQSVNFSVMFDPSSGGAATGSVQVTPSDGTAPLTIALSGTGVTSGTPPTHSVALNWAASPSTVAGYNVYRGNQSGGPYTISNTALVSGTAFSDSSVVAGQTYWYVVTAVNSSGVESAHSNEAMAAVPTP